MRYAGDQAHNHLAKIWGFYMDEFIKVKILTKESFEKYGTVLEKPENTKADVEREFLDYWNGLYDIRQDCEFTVGCLCIKRQQFEIRQLERHLTGPEIFIPLSGISIIPFAARGENPEEEEIEIFLLDGTQGIVIDSGIWHFPPLPISPDTKLLLCVPKYVSSDLEMRDVPSRKIIL